eukprot:gene16558-16738_t
MLCIYVLSFQDVRGGLVFPVKGLSLHWFIELFTQARTGDVKGAFDRSIKLAAAVTVLTVVISFLAGLGFRRRFRGDKIVFTLMIGSLVAPGLVLGIGVGLIFNALGFETQWYTSALGAHLSWTLPFGVLVMFAVMSRFDHAWEEAARDLGATPWQCIRLVMIPVLLPGLIAVALFGFTLSYDEFARSLQTAGALNTLPLEIWSMTLNITSPSLYALGTVTTIVSFLAIGLSLGTIAYMQKRRASRAGQGHIELAGVVKTYDGFTKVVDGINLKIPDGAYCCFLGPSGCGKTTILRMIAGHEDPTAGEILIGGENGHQPPTGAHIDVAVRRDDIDLRRPTDGAVNPDTSALPGRVRSVEYQGSYVKVMLDPVGHDEFIVYVPERKFYLNSFAVGDLVVATWDVSHARLLA